MSRLRLTRAAKAFIALMAVSAAGISVAKNPRLFSRAPALSEPKSASNVPPIANLPFDSSFPVVSESAGGCANLPEVRFYLWAWNAQQGLMLANGGKQSTESSAMCKHGVNLKLIREDNVDQMQAQLLAFAEAKAKGEKNPAVGAHFVAIMGDGSAVFLQGLEERLAKVDQGVAVVGSAGYSRGEDKFMGPPSWRADPQAARGGVVAGVLRDGDWNIALKWLGDNKIPNNPDEHVYDPDALNWIAASDYVDAASKYVSGHCADLRNIRTGKTEKHCVDAVVTWTPGDVTVAEGKGGLVSIVSTKEYRAQMPNVIIGNRTWMSEHRDLTKGMLQAIFEAGDRIKSDDAALREASAVSALVYKEKDAAYWYRYFTVQRAKDKLGLEVELGGSSVNNLADNLQLFGLAAGSPNAFGATYTVFANVARSQYPLLLPSFPPVEKVTDLSYLRELAATAPATKADVPIFDKAQTVTKVISRRAWDIQFETGSAKFTPEAQKELARLRDELVVAGGAMIEVHGHTDAQGSAEANQRLSEDRAFAVKSWLEESSKSAFPEGRIKVVAHGQTEPVAPNSTAEGRAKNRRVVIVMGTPSS
jgi:outer membrane protein OmpA-like peptidoglycan-associated protein